MPFFGKNKSLPLSVDLHSHLIPGIDDGAQNMDQSISMIRELVNLGFQKIITTPHIHPRYPNTSELIMEGLSKLQVQINRLKIPIEIEAAAEYFVDETFYEGLNNDKPLLAFGGRYVLVESSFINKPVFFDGVMFDLIAKGYKPILAHPERYQFLGGSIQWLRELKEMGVLFQITLGSVAGYYGEKPKQVSKQLISKKMVDFLGSDLHRESHLPYLEKGLNAKDVQQLIKNKDIKNHELL